jgi:hypothetical protein
MSSAAHQIHEDGTLERSEMIARTRADLRAHHRQLTEQQIDLIAEVAVEIRLTSFRVLQSFDVAQAMGSAGR